MATIAYEVTAVTKFKGSDGAEKARFTKIGVVFETAKGLRLKMESVPIGWDGWAMLQEPRTKDKPATRPDDFDTEV